MPARIRPSPVRSTIIVVALTAGAAWLSIRSARTAPRPPRFTTTVVGRDLAGKIEPSGAGNFAARNGRALENDYRAACERAASLADSSRRNEAIRAALLAWSKADPAAALGWADGCTDDRRSGALAIVAEVLSAQPERAVEIGRKWMRLHPSAADELGSILIGALVRRAAFAAALQLVGEGPANSSDSWCCLVVGAWAQRDPASALDLAEALRRQSLPGRVFAALAQGWAQSAPEQLVAYAATLPAGEDRTTALHAGLDQWLLRDPSAAGAWIRQLADPQEHDQALAAYLTRTDQVERSTPAALALAEEITDSTLRFTALQHLVRELAAENSPDVTRRYVATVVGLDPQQRQQLVSNLGPTSDRDAVGNSLGL